ncbi:MAG: BlaI family penicillinase repressor [Flavobacteriales bacterium]|jgi:BlaI family penicillinase repressor
MAPKALNDLSRRERQIMDVLYELGHASAQDVLARIPEPPSYSAVRALMARLVEKGLIDHKNQSNRYIYFPLIEQGRAQKSALTRLINTFFKGSKLRAFSALLDVEGGELSEREIDDIERKIRRLKQNAENAREK